MVTIRRASLALSVSCTFLNKEKSYFLYGNGQVSVTACLKEVSGSNLEREPATDWPTTMRSSVYNCACALSPSPPKEKKHILTAFFWIENMLYKEVRVFSLLIFRNGFLSNLNSFLPITVEHLSYLTQVIEIWILKYTTGRFWQYIDQSALTSSGTFPSKGLR